MSRTSNEHFKRLFLLLFWHIVSTTARVTQFKEYTCTKYFFYYNFKFGNIKYDETYFFGYC